MGEPSRAARPLYSDEVLVLDDDHDVCDAIAALASSDGFTSTVFTDGRDALRYLRDVALPRLILVDVRMPGIDGWEFLRQLGTIPFADDVPAFLMSADTTLDETRARRFGARGVLRKPFDIATLSDILHLHVGMAGP